MQFTFKDNQTGEEKTKPMDERWVWGAVYRPTAAQIADAEKKTEELQAKLRPLRRAALEEAKARNATKEEIVKIIREYNQKMELGVQAEQDELHQFDSVAGVYHRVGEIDFDRLEMFSVFKPGDMKRRVDIPWSEDMTLIFKPRMTKPFYLNDFVRSYMIGWRKKTKVEDQKKPGVFHTRESESYMFILPDDRIVYSPTENPDLVKFNVGR